MEKDKNKKMEDRQIELPKEAFNCIILGKNMSEKSREDIKKEVFNNIGEIPILDELEICNI